MNTPFNPTEPNMAFRTYDVDEAIRHLIEIYDRNIKYLQRSFRRFVDDKLEEPVVAHYPYLAFTLDKPTRVDPLVSYGFLRRPGRHSITITRPKFFEGYLREQMVEIFRNHPGIKAEVGISNEPIPIDYAFTNGLEAKSGLTPERNEEVSHYFTRFDPTHVHNLIVQQKGYRNPDGSLPLGLYTASRIDYSMTRYGHYLHVSPENVQPYQLFTNYQKHIDVFREEAEKLIKEGIYEALIGPNDEVLFGKGASSNPSNGYVPQFPSLHLKSANGDGISIICTGVGSANVKNITDHLAVLRPYAWQMLGHCASTQGQQNIGDIILPSSVVYGSNILDPWLGSVQGGQRALPLPEIQLEAKLALAEILGMPSDSDDFKRRVRTGAVWSTDDRNWELLGAAALERMFAENCAAAVDMETSTVIGQGYLNRVGADAVLLVSDRPLQGVGKMRDGTSHFYNQSKHAHVRAGIGTMRGFAQRPIMSRVTRKGGSDMSPAFR